jgi:predicted RNase H-like nuclease
LAWTAKTGKGIFAIEVYPAGTLRSYERSGIVSKRIDKMKKKRSLIAKLESKGRMLLRTGLKRATENEHVLDSILCIIAATDFLEGKVIRPVTSEETELSKKEGWIWIRKVDE